MTKCSLCLSPSDLLVFGVWVSVASVAGWIDDRRVSTHDFMGQSDVSSECPFLAMRCVILAWSQPRVPLEI